METINISGMTSHSIPPELREILLNSFYIRTTLIRKNGTPRTIETTFVWDGGNKLILSGYPGKRDWVASMSRNPSVTVHSVEFEPWFDIPATALVIRNLDEKLPRVISFIEHWALRPGFPRTRFKFLLGAVKINRSLKLHGGGPSCSLKKYLMECLVWKLLFLENR